MLPADGLGTSQTPAPSSPAARRLEAALDRISTALVGRVEREAALRDRLEQEAENARRFAEAAGSGAVSAAPGIDPQLLDELRFRLDAAIGRVRAALDDS